MRGEQSSVVSARCGSTEPRNCKLLASLNYGFCLLRDLIDVIVCELSPSVRITSFVTSECRRSVWNLLRAAKQLYTVDSTIDISERRKWFSCMWQKCKRLATHDDTFNYSWGLQLFIVAINLTGFYFTSISLFVIFRCSSALFLTQNLRR